MNIFFSSYLGGTHGTAKSARDFLRALLACRGPVRVISPNIEQFPAIVCDKKLSMPEWFDMPKGVKFPLAPWDINFCRISEWLKDKRSFRRLRHIKSNDVVFVNGWASCGAWQLVKGFFSGPKVIIVRESPRHFSGPDRDELHQDLLGVFSSFDYLIFVSERVCNEWRHYEEIASRPYSSLPNCCEEEEAIKYVAMDRAVLRKQLGFHANDFVVLCPGTIEHRKGQDLLLDVVPELHSQIPNLRVLLVGDPATKWGEDLLRAVPHDLPGRTVSHWHSRPGIMDLLRASDVLAFPSRAEAMPRTILEAMVMKTPVVASNVDGIPELVEDGETGMLFSRDDKKGLLCAILCLYEKHELRKHMSDSGSDRYWAHFSRRRQFERMVHVLENIYHTSSKYSNRINTQ
jgi:glycosyltransferase involved in cell wall biosynthesis